MRQVWVVADVFQPVLTPSSLLSFNSRNITRFQGNPNDLLLAGPHPCFSSVQQQLIGPFSVHQYSNEAWLRWWERIA
jgi:hypothetical protein